jgi:hypothetical protein
MSELVALLPPPLRNFPTWDLLATIESSGSSPVPTSTTGQPSAGTVTGQAGNKRDAIGDTGNNALDGGSDGGGVLQSAWQNVLQNHADSVPQLQKAAAQLRWLQAHSKGAHVLAPCAHDGVCPMDTPGMNSWCHFSQRVERRFLHRQCVPCPSCFLCRVPRKKECQASKRSVLQCNTYPFFKDRCRVVNTVRGSGCLTNKNTSCHKICLGCAGAATEKALKMAPRTGSTNVIRTS